MTRYVTLYHWFMYGSLLLFGSVPYTANAAEVVAPTCHTQCVVCQPAESPANSPLHVMTNDE